MACVIIPSLQMVTLKLRQGSDLSKPSLGQYWVLNSLLRTSSLQVHLLWVSFSDITSHTLCLFKKICLDASGLSCYTQDLLCNMKDPSL